jgi:hypothetical protein
MNGRKILRVGDAPGGNYIRKVAALVEAYPELEGSYSEVDVRHDGWCRIYRGAPCNCDPDVEFRKVQ